MKDSIQERLKSLDWQAIGERLSCDGYAVTSALLPPQECAELAAAYDQDALFRSRIVMARFGFGRGEYKYFKNPLPEVVSRMREDVYPPLAAIANEWAATTGGSIFPAQLGDFLKICHDAGQTKPTPLLLKYEPGDFNCMHQDLYGDVAFPFQMTIFLSQPGRDYTGGEFVLVEQRPRMQSPTVILPRQGEAVIFPTRYRAVQGTRGFYRANLKHGVSPLRSGRRFTLGIIFHDAK